MLTHSYFQNTNDPDLLWAQLTEWGLRELSYRKAHPDEAVNEKPLTELVPAQDAGDVCGVCGELVTWVDHLPPPKWGEPVRCYKNVIPIERATVVDLDDIFPRV